LNTAKLNFAALPQQIKQQAQLITQQLSQGAIDIRTAQVQLDYLPKQLQAGINASNRSGRGGSGGGSRGGSGGLKSSTGLTSAVNKAIGEVSDIVNESSYDSSARLGALNDMYTYYSKAGGNDAKYMTKVVSQAIATVKSQQKNGQTIGKKVVTSKDGRFSGY